MSCPCFDNPDSTVHTTVKDMAGDLAEVLAMNANLKSLCPHGVAQWIYQAVMLLGKTTLEDGSETPTTVKEELARMFANQGTVH